MIYCFSSKKYTYVRGVTSKIQKHLTQNEFDLSSSTFDWQNKTNCQDLNRSALQVNLAKLWVSLWKLLMNIYQTWGPWLKEARGSSLSVPGPDEISDLRSESVAHSRRLPGINRGRALQTNGRFDFSWQSQRLWQMNQGSVSKWMSFALHAFYEHMNYWCVHMIFLVVYIVGLHGNGTETGSHMMHDSLACHTGLCLCTLGANFWFKWLCVQCNNALISWSMCIKRSYVQW